MTSFGVTSAMSVLKILSYVYDVLTLPVYLVIQRPWEKQKASARVKSKVVDKGEHSVTYRSVDSPREAHLCLIREKIETMGEVFKWGAEKHKNKPCVGTRKILAGEDEIQPDGSVFKKYKMGEYEWKSYREVEKMVGSFGRGLKSLGLSQKNVVIFAETRVEWMVAAYSCFQQNLTVVTIYATLGDESIVHGINETEVDTVITSHDILPKFKRLLQQTPNVKNVIYMEDQLVKTDTAGYKEDVRLVSFSEVMKMGEDFETSTVSTKGDDVAVIMYTSGSTGVSKGVLLTHRNMLAVLKGFCDAMILYETDVFLGSLPLAHVYELLAESVFFVNGVRIGYSSPLTMIDSSPKILQGTMGDASVLRPTCLTTVPLILDRITKAIHEKVKKSSPFKQALFTFACQYKRKWMQRGYDTPLLNRLIFGATKKVLGGRVRLMISGGAPLTSETHTQIRLCFCVNMTQGYGLTETCAGGTIMDNCDRSTERAGAPLTVCDIRLENWEGAGYRVTDRPHPRGEIVIGGDNVSPGYYKLAEKTEQDFFEKDGRRWFRSGDIAEIQQDGCIKIIDRKKDLVKLQSGEYVSLGKVEAEMMTCPLVDNICVIEDARENCAVALVVPNRRGFEEVASNLGITFKSFEELCENPGMEKVALEMLQEHAKKRRLRKIEIVRAVKLCSEQWSPDSGLVTASFKLKRRLIKERYQHKIEQIQTS